MNDVTSCTTNWSPSNEGDNFSYFEVGVNRNKHRVERILYHEPQGDGDRHYIDVVFDNASRERFFNLDSIGFKGE